MTPGRDLRRHTRSLQIAFLVLLGISGTQLAWWLVDQVRYTAEVRSRQLERYATDAAAARALLVRGAPWSEVARLYPELEHASGDSVVVAARLRARLDRERFHRLNRYGWEGAFFLLVLVGAMSVVWRALREEADLRRRQEQFLADVSHELKSPLASLRLSAETLALRDPALPRRAELVRRQLGDVARLERMIRNLLDSARLSAATVHANPEPVVLAAEVDAAIEEVREQAADSGVALVSVVQPEISVHADPEGVRTILRNLLQNALTAAAGDGQVSVRAAADDGHVRLEVQDNGVGFPREEGSRLFEKFYRLDGPSHARMTGNGLGLFLVRRCAELDAGSVSGASEGPGQGATFTVRWPANGMRA